MRRVLAVAGALLATGLGVFFVGGGSSSSGGAVGIGRIQRFGGRSVPRATSTCTTYPERTNYTLRSQEHSTAPWDVVQQGSANPVITLNAATAPACNLVNNATGCGAMTASEIAFPELDPDDYSFIYQLDSCPGTNPQTGSLWFKGKTTSGTVEISIGASDCVQCAVTTDWTQCTITATTGTNVSFGAKSNVHGCPAGVRPAFTVYVWNVDCQEGSNSPPVLPIKTTTATVTRAAGCY